MTGMEEKLGRIFREIYLDVFKDGTPEERRGMIIRSRFDRTVAKVVNCKNTRRNTNGYWATAQGMGLIMIERPDPLSGRAQTFDRATVREDIWENDGFILEEGEGLRSKVASTVKVEIVRRHKAGVVCLEEMI